MSILSGDIGGTKTRLALLRHGPAGLEIQRQQTYASGDYPGLTDIVQAFLDSLDHTPDAAGFGLAGPVRGRQCRITNLPWLVDADRMEGDLGIPRIILLNDLEAVAWGIPALGNEDCLTLQPGLDQASGNRCVLAPGTGLGEAGLYWDGEIHHPFATEGGHCDFAPTTSQQGEFYRYLQRSHPQPAWENVLSGPGLISIYKFLSEQAGNQPPERFLSALKEGHGAAWISRAADTGSDSMAIAALEEFVRLLATEAGNLALKHMATGGLYIGGGIAPQVLQWLQRPLFLEVFHNKGKMRELMRSIPVQVILNERAALFGPALLLDNHNQARQGIGPMPPGAER